MEGAIAESLSELDLENSEVLNRLSDEITKRIQQMIQRTLHKLQKEYYADVLELGEYLRQNHPLFWGRVKDHWDGKSDGLFTRTRIEVMPEIFIRNVGSANRTDIQRKAD